MDLNKKNLEKPFFFGNSDRDRKEKNSCFFEQLPKNLNQLKFLENIGADLLIQNYCYKENLLFAISEFIHDNDTYLKIIRYLIEEKKIEISTNNYSEYFWETFGITNEILLKLYQANLIPYYSTKIKTIIGRSKLGKTARIISAFSIAIIAYGVPYLIQNYLR